MSGSVRASDAERALVVERLERAVGQGRLTLDEFAERVAAAHAATTRRELTELRVALGPAMDYGTYLIAAKGRNPGIFESAKWDTPAEFADLVRLAEAAKLLHQQIPVQEVAERVGFMDAKYFSTVFKKHYGVSPSKYE